MSARYLVFSGLLHAYIGVRLVPSLAEWPWAVAMLVLLLVVSSLLIPLGFAARRRQGARWPDALHGFTIAQISDIHVGPTIKEAYVRAIVDAVNRLDADMVAVTGDLVDGSVAELAVHVAPLAGLASRHGTFFVTGNHEYYSG